MNFLLSGFVTKKRINSDFSQDLCWFLEFASGSSLELAHFSPSLGSHTTGSPEPTIIQNCPAVTFLGNPSLKKRYELL